VILLKNQKKKIVYLSPKRDSIHIKTKFHDRQRQDQDRDTSEKTSSCWQKRLFSWIHHNTQASLCLKTDDQQKKWWTETLTERQGGETIFFHSSHLRKSVKLGCSWDRCFIAFSSNDIFPGEQFGQHQVRGSTIFKWSTSHKAPARLDLGNTSWTGL